MPAKPPVTNPKITATLKGVVADARLVPMLNYLFLFLMVMFIGVTGIVALLVANFREDNAPDWLKSHYEFQKRTFWIGIGPTLAAYAIMMPILHLTDERAILLILAGPLAYTAGRAAFGFNHLFHGRPMPNPKAWII